MATGEPMDWMGAFASSKRRAEEAETTRVAKAKPSAPPKKPGQDDGNAAADASAESSASATRGRGRQTGKGAGKHRGSYAHADGANPYPGNNRPVPNSILNILVVDHLAMRNEAR
eukprot:13828820-Heterocapsa_arctica.AAC.1